MDWSTSNSHQIATYAALYETEELNPNLIPFKKAGDTKLSSLNFYIRDDASHPVRLVAMGIVEYIIDLYQPNWEDPENIGDIPTLLTKIGEVLADKEKTISDLADTIDQCFKFSGEGEES